MRRLRPRRATKVVGRGFGMVVVLAALPALLDLVIGEVTWRAATMRSGGVAGYFIASRLESRLGFVGALFLILGAVIVGSTLILQSSLGELLESWGTQARRAVAELVAAPRAQDRAQGEGAHPPPAGGEAPQRARRAGARRGEGRAAVSSASAASSRSRAGAAAQEAAEGGQAEVAAEGDVVRRRGAGRAEPVAAAGQPAQPAGGARTRSTRPSSSASASRSRSAAASSASRARSRASAPGRSSPCSSCSRRRASR